MSRSSVWTRLCAPDSQVRVCRSQPVITNYSGYAEQLITAIPLTTLLPALPPGVVAESAEREPTVQEVGNSVPRRVKPMTYRSYTTDTDAP